MSISVEELSALQFQTDRIRNITILAHVDHGKTTLCDYLISSNGIISQKLAGKVRYMDSRVDEQEREITMKASSISLLHEAEGKYLINLIDSPGHIDFSSEVSNAVRVSDGALVLVDAVEGVQVQTTTVLKQAWDERLDCVLVINKMDKLFTELKLTATEAYVCTQRIIEQVNAITSSFLVSEAMAKAASVEKTDVVEEKKVRDEDQVIDANSKYEVEIDESAGIVFAPERGNVIFASSIDSWAFTLTEMAQFYSKKLGFKKEVLERCLWGDHFYQAKSKSVVKKPPTSSANVLPMFVQFVMEPICQIYTEFLVNKNLATMHKIIDKLEVKIPPREILREEWRPRLRALFSHWLPLQQCVLNAVVKQLPSPLKAQPNRIGNFWKPTESQKLKYSSNESDSKLELIPGQFASSAVNIDKDGRCDKLYDAIVNVDTRSSAPVFVYVAKMFSVPKESMHKKSANVIVRKQYIRGLFQTLPDNKAALDKFATETVAQAANGQQSETASINSENFPGAVKLADAGKVVNSSSLAAALEDLEEKDDEVFIAFARIFSGTLTSASKIYIFGPKYDPLKHDLHENDDSKQEDIDPGFTDDNLNIRKSKVAFQDLFVCSVDPHEFQLYLLMGRDIEPINSIPAGNVFGIGGLDRYIQTTATISTLPKVIPMNPMSYQSLPIVRVAIEPKNISHLKDLTRGLKLLTQADQNVEIALQDTGEYVLVVSGELHLERCIRDLKDKYAKGLDLKISEPIVPFRESLSLDLKLCDVTTVTTANKLITFTLRAYPLPPNVFAFLVNAAEKMKQFRSVDEADKEKAEDLLVFLKNLESEMRVAGGHWKDFSAESLWCFGPRYYGANLLLISNESPYLKSMSTSIMAQLKSKVQGSLSNNEISTFQSIENSIVSGFQIASNSGPLCEEPMMSVAFQIEDIQIVAPEQHLVNDPYGPLSGQVMSCIKEGCRKAFSAAAPRLMEPIYKVELQATAEVLGRLYGVISKRRGHILDEQLREGTNIFSITASLPVTESFGFADELRKKTSGVANPQLIFSHWSLLVQDPYFVPTTEEELEAIGSIDNSLNLARSLIDKTRRRKGLFVEEKLVSSGTKQRTLSKKA